MTLDPRDLPRSEWSPYAGVKCQIVGDSGSDLLKPVGEDTTKTKFVLVRTPDACANMANRLQGGVPHLQTTATHAAALMANSTWRSLNENLAYELVPHLMSPRPEAQVRHATQVTTEPAKPDGRLARLLKAAEKRKRVETALLVDPKRNDRLIAQACGANRKDVIDARRRLEQAGDIPRVPVEERTGIERARKYRTKAQRVAEVAAQTKAWRERSKK